MQAVDRINRDWGRDTVRFAASGTRRPWAMKQGFKSPRYTTCWQDLKKVGG
jgi:DNA polymerase V